MLINLLNSIWFKTIKFFEAYFIIMFPELYPFIPYSNMWHNSFDGFFYDYQGLRYDSISKLYFDLFSFSYVYHKNLKVFYNNEIKFNQDGFYHVNDQLKKIDFLGNCYHWDQRIQNYVYSKLWYPPYEGEGSLGKTENKPLSGKTVAARIFLMENDFFKLHRITNDLFMFFDSLIIKEEKTPFLLSFFLKFYNWIKNNFFAAKVCLAGFLVIGSLNGESNFTMEIAMGNSPNKISQETKSTISNKKTFNSEEKFKRTPPLKKEQQEEQGQPRREASSRNFLSAGTQNLAKKTSNFINNFIPTSEVNGMPRQAIKDEITQKYGTEDLINDVKDVELKKFDRTVEERFKNSRNKQPYDPDEIEMSSISNARGKIEQQMNIAAEVYGSKVEKKVSEKIANPNADVLQNIGTNGRLRAKLNSVFDGTYGSQKAFGKQINDAMRNSQDENLTTLEVFTTIKDEKASLDSSDKKVLNTIIGNRLNPQAVNAHGIPMSYSESPRAGTPSFFIPYGSFPSNVVNNEENNQTLFKPLEKVLDNNFKIEYGTKELPEPLEITDDFGNTTIISSPDRIYLIETAKKDRNSIEKLNPIEKKYVEENSDLVSRSQQSGSGFQ